MFDWFDELKASVETGTASGIEAGFKALGESFNNGIGEWFQVPEPAEPYRTHLRSPKKTIISENAIYK